MAPSKVILVGGMGSLGRTVLLQIGVEEDNGGQGRRFVASLLHFHLCRLRFQKVRALGSVFARGPDGKSAAEDVGILVY